MQRRAEEGLPAAVPQRLRADQARRPHSDRAARALRALGDAGQQQRLQGRPARVEPQRRLQPGPADHGPPAVHPHAGPVPALGDRAGQRPRPLPRPQAAAAPARRAHGQAPDRVGRARRRGRAGEDAQPDHPPGQEPRERPPLRGGAPQPGPARAARALADHLEAAEEGAAQGKGEALERLPGLELHRRKRQVHDRPPAADPRRRLPAARRPQARRRRHPGQAARLLDHRRAGLHAPRRTR